MSLGKGDADDASLVAGLVVRGDGVMAGEEGVGMWEV